MPKKSIYHDYQPSTLLDQKTDSGSYYFIFYHNKLLINRHNNDIPFLKNLNQLPAEALRQIYMGQLRGSPCFVVEIESSFELSSLSFIDLKELYSILEYDIYLLAGRAIQIINWDKNHQFCGKCGSSTRTMEGEMAKICPDCGHFNYPRLSPAIITAIVKEDKLLMARHTYGITNRYGLVAGFVEAGETLEEAVQRETSEEVGLKIKNIKYFGSQPWPYPNSLMVGFTAEYHEGEIKVDGKEIEDARWFRASEIQKRPSSISISGELIEWFIDKYSC
ncbi:NAD(+) diphosphatase [Methanobacterium movens]